MENKKFAGLCIVIAALTSSATDSAQATAITSLPAFMAALPGPAGWLDFDALPAGAALSGTAQALAGLSDVQITFPVQALDYLGLPVNFTVAGSIAGSNPTTSGSHSLGTDDGGNFNLVTAGTRFSLALNMDVNAFGMTFVTPDELFDDDIRLLVGSEVASLSVVERTPVASPVGTVYYAYFLGIVSSTPFSSVSVGYGPAVSGGPFLYNIDDIRVARDSVLPEPGSLALVALGLSISCLLPRPPKPCA